LASNLARHGSAPNPGNPAWLGRDTGQQTIRVLHEPGQTALPYCLDPHRGRLYEAVFRPGTPDAVIIAAIEAALSPSPPQAGRGQSRQATGHRRRYPLCGEDIPVLDITVPPAATPRMIAAEFARFLGIPTLATRSGLTSKHGQKRPSGGDQNGV
jgi:hypothetical protein